MSPVAIASAAGDALPDETKRVEQVEKTVAMASGLRGRKLAGKWR
jgi:hypothetical protein